MNIDSVGQAGKPLHVVGRSKWPELASVVERAAKAAGVEVGGDIDKQANRWGSDHWPWSAKGIPAVNLFQADRAMLGSEKDSLALVDGASLAKMADAVEAAIRELAK